MPDIRPSTLHPTLTFSALPWHWVAAVAKQQLICSSAWLVSRCRRQDQHHNSNTTIPIRDFQLWDTPGAGTWTLLHLNIRAPRAASSWGLVLPFDTVENSRVMKWSIQTLTTWAKDFTSYRGIQDDLQQNSLSSFILKTHPRSNWLFYFVAGSSGNFILEVKKALTPSDSHLRSPCITQSLFSFFSHLLGVLLIAKLLIAKFPVLL